MDAAAPPSRWPLVAAGVLTQVVGVVYLVLALASFPAAHDLHVGTHAILVSVVAAIAAIVCGTLVWRGKLVPLALAAGLDIGFGVGLPRGSSTIGASLRALPGDADTADTLVVGVAIAMFVAAILCVLAIPAALKLRAWARAAAQPAPRTSQLGSTLPGVVPAKAVPTQLIRLPGPSRRKPLVIAGVAIGSIAIGIGIITAATGSNDSGSATVASGSAAAGSASAPLPRARGGSGAVTAVVPAAPATDAGVGVGVAVAVSPDAPPEPPHVDDLLARFHAALASDQPADLALVFSAHAFAFGVLANEIAEGREAVVATLRHDLGAPPRSGFTVTPRFSQVGHTADVAWIAEELKVGDQVFELTAVAGIEDGAWEIAALHVGLAMPNETAYRLARDGQLADPDAIPDAHDESELAKAMRQAFASKPSFVAARSARPDAVNFGSAPGERLLGGEAIRKVFGRLRASLRLHDAVKVGTVGADGGWGAANVDFTDADRDGVQVTQTFRVLVAWVREGQDLRIVQTQFSNAR